MLEADVKRNIIKEIKEAGGYARRIEDQYAVGIPDLVVIPAGCPVFFVEAKVFTGHVFAPTPRQFVELGRIELASRREDGKLHAYGVVVGWKQGVYYVSDNRKQVVDANCFPHKSFLTALMEFYDSVR